MKKIHKYVSLLLVATGFLVPALAQRGEHRGNGGGSQSRVSGSRPTYSSPRQNSSPAVRQNHPSFGQTDRRTSSVQTRQSNSPVNRPDRNVRTGQQRPNSGTISRPDGRTSVRSSAVSDARVRNRGNNNNAIVRNDRINRQNSTARVSDLRRGNYGQRDRYRQNRFGVRNRYEPRRYYYSGYRHYSALPRTSISIYFGGYPYYYCGGLFYSYYDGFYEPVYAPFGIRIHTLPYGYYPFYVGSIPYYYYEGIYYRNYDNNEYEVVDAPMGAIVSTLPKGATVAIINGEKFYEFNGTYYKEGVNSKNQVVYTVVGKYGEVNNSDEADTGSVPSWQVGDVVDELPADSKPVTLNGESLYLSPDHIYFKEQVKDGQTRYEVVGMDEDNQ
jgi:Family of unknown function (DUF6515)